MKVIPLSKGLNTQHILFLKSFGQKSIEITVKTQDLLAAQSL